MGWNFWIRTRSKRGVKPRKEAWNLLRDRVNIFIGGQKFVLGYNLKNGEIRCELN